MRGAELVARDQLGWRVGRRSRDAMLADGDGCVSVCVLMSSRVGMKLGWSWVELGRQLWLLRDRRGGAAESPLPISTKHSSTTTFRVEESGDGCLLRRRDSRYERQGNTSQMDKICANSFTTRSWLCVCTE